MWRTRPPNSNHEQVARVSFPRSAQPTFLTSFGATVHSWGQLENWKAPPPPPPNPDCESCWLEAAATCKIQRSDPQHADRTPKHPFHHHLPCGLIRINFTGPKKDAALCFEGVRIILKVVLARLGLPGGQHTGLPITRAQKQGHWHQDGHSARHCSTGLGAC